MKLGAEDKIQLAILEYLEIVLPPYAVVLHVPNGGWRSLSEGIKFKLLGVRKGAADLLILLPPQARSFWLEVKSPKGRVSPEQTEFGEDVRALGGGWAVVRSIEDVRNALAAWGIQTREAA